MNEHPDFLDEIVHSDPTNRQLAAALRPWRDASRDATVVPDERLQARFSHEPPVKRPAVWRQWLQRPAIAFAASFAAVLIVGVGAFALVDRNSETNVAATSTSLATATSSAQPGQITLPEDLSEQTGYASCVFGQLATWFTGGFAGEDAPALVDDCGLPPIPDLGPEAEAFRADLQTWASCVAGEVQAKLPELPALIADHGAGIEELESDCGEPPNPADYDLAVPFADFDWENFDPSQFDFGPLDLGEFNLEGFDLDQLDIGEFLENLPEGFLPEDFDLNELKTRFGDFDWDTFKQDVEACDFSTLEEDLRNLESLEDLDFKTFFEEFESGKLCGFAGFSFLEDLDFEGLDFEGLDLSALDLSGLDLSGLDLEGLDLEALLSSILGDGELNLESLFAELSEQSG